MTKPLIGLTTTLMPDPYRHPAYAVGPAYVIAIQSAGGLPVFISNDMSDDDQAELLARLDGILFTGGYDVDPASYGHPPHTAVEKPDARRDHTEIYLTHKLVETRKPFLGICRGIQIINVALGGSAYEHLPDQLSGNVHLENHDKPRNYLAHSISLRPGSHLEQLLGTQELLVNSLHHQGVRDLAKDLQATAIAPDGLVEACELPTHPFGLAVQWHPEELLQSSAMRNLFTAFVQACRVEKPA